MGINIGLEASAVDGITKRLSIFLSDLHQLYVKALAYHWNLEGPHFLSLHEFFEELYKELAGDMDSVAERIRQLGRKSPSTVEQMTQMKRLGDTEECDSGSAMLAQLESDYSRLVLHLREDISYADSQGDVGTADALTQLLRQYEKNIWFLHSHKSTS